MFTFMLDVQYILKELCMAGKAEQATGISQFNDNF